MRIRLGFSKHGKVRYTSHRDVARIWERAWRKAELPIEYTQGFSPRPKVHFGLALPTGYESDAEYLDVDVPDDEADRVPIEGLPERLTDGMPDGIAVWAAAVIAPGTMSLQEAVTSCSWAIEIVGGEPATVSSAVNALLGSDSVIVARTRKGKTIEDDIRPSVLKLAIAAPSKAGTLLDAELGAQPRALRASELMTGLEHFLDHLPEIGWACRTHQWIASGGAREEPLPLPATRTSHVEARAS